MFKTWMFLALLTAWVPSFAPAGITNPFSSTTPSPSTANRPANGSSFNASDGVPNGPEYGTMLHNLSLGPLPCSAAWPYLHRREMGVCQQLWPPGAPLPQVRCDAVGGFRQIADTFTTLIHGIGMYQTVSSMVDAGAGASRWSGWCVTQTSYEMRKVDSLPPGVPVAEDFVLAKSVSNSQEHDGDADADGKDFIFAIVSQGLRRYRVDFRPMVLGAIAALVTDEQCPSCPTEMWHIDLLWTPATLNLYLNLAKGILMEFQPAYTPLASTILRSLKAYSRVEEVTVHGGDHWNASVLVLAELRSLQRVDFAGSGLAELSDENFPRMPNLVHLDLSNNKFSSVPIGIRTLRSLRTLNVSNNPLETMQFAPTLRSLQQLEVLNVSRIPLESLDTLILDEGVENLDDNFTVIGDKWRVLDASACNLSDVNTTATRILFRRLRNLHELILADNPLTTVPHDFLVNIRELQVLDLSGCRLTQPPGLRLWPGARLQLLDLSRNALLSPAGALSAQGGGGGGGAALLDVSGNPLRGEWGAQAFAALGPRAAVNLSRTELTALTAPMLSALRPLRLVDLGANPIDCAKCAIRYLQEWLNTTSAEAVSLGRRGPLQCGLPPERRGWAVGDVRNPPPAQCAGRAAGGGAAWAAGAAVGVALAVGAAAVLLVLRFRMLVTYAMHVVRANRAMRSGAGGAGCEFDAFVCYSKHDRPWVMGKLLPRLEGSNPRYRLCLHERDFPLGSLIVQNIVECMARSRHTIMILTPAFVGSQWCQWELEMATHRVLEGAGRDFLVLVELQPLDAKALPRLLRLLVETRTFLQWPSGCAPGEGCGGGAEGAEEAAWRRLRAALGSPIKRSSRHGLSSHASALALSLQALDSPPPAPASPPPPETTVAVRSVALVKDKDSCLSEEDIQLSTLT